MTFLYTLASVFITNYIVWIIIRAIGFKHHRLVYLILITIFELTSVITWGIIAILSAVSYVSYTEDKTGLFMLILDYLGYMLGVLSAYLLTLVLHLRGVKIFKSRRQREFERESKTPKQRLIANVLFYSLLSVLGLSLIGLGIGTFFMLNGQNAFFYSLTISGILLFIFLLVNFILSKTKAKDKPVTKGKVLFFVKTNGTYYTYFDTLDNGGKIEDKLGRIGEEYILTDFGVLIMNNDKIRVLGITPSEIEMSLLDNISLKKEEKDLSYILNEYSKYQRKKIVLNQDQTINKIANI